jgi:tetratricopeptide (TPR) repeat protein
MVLSYGMRQPWLLAGLLVVWLLRGVLPPPGALFGALGRAGRLREQVRLNRANITARRDLATIYLGLLRPRRAVALLEEGLELAPEDAELLYLHGLALERAGEHERALTQELAALERDPRVRQGHPYFVAGDALLELKRWDDAADAFERYIDFNSSDVSAHTRLARAYAGSGDLAAARKWLYEGITTWQGLPGAMKRRQLGAMFGAQWARVVVLKQPLAIVVALLLVTLGVLGARATYPAVVGLFQRDPADNLSNGRRALAADKLCGTVSTGEFEGDYETAEADGGEPIVFHVARDRINYGRTELCLTKLKERAPGKLVAEAVSRWRPTAEDLPGSDPNDLPTGYSMLVIRLDRGTDSVALSQALIDHPQQANRILLKKRQ